MNRNKLIATLTITAIVLTATSFLTGPGHFTGIDLAATGCIWTALLMWLHETTTRRQATSHR